MPAAVFELPGVDLVQGVVHGGFGGPEINVHRRHPAIGRHVVEPHLAGLDGGLAVPEVKEGPGRTHGGKSPGGHHIHLPGRGRLPFLAHDVDDFLGRHHHRLALFNLLVDFLKSLINLIRGHGISSRAKGLRCLPVSLRQRYLSLSQVSFPYSSSSTPPAIFFPFLALCSGLAPGTARALAGRACLFGFLILAFFVTLGRLVLTFFGISLPAFQIAGGLVLFRIAFDMMEGRGHFNRLDTPTSLAPGDYRDIALIPLAMPLLSGPGAISTVLVLTARSKSLPGRRPPGGGGGADYAHELSLLSPLPPGSWASSR